ncbi:MAG: biotin--[acetyl-CoA-carboxylase] ligase [Bacteroidetes bacterium]|nr:biotin--[acetyl-CoA-carboxylase] ligase [Bacteroidota bacterium]
MDNRLQTLFTGRQATFLETVNSTNSYLLHMLSKNHLPEGSVIVAHHQSEGRGQASEKWVSETGKNLLLSIVFYPSFLSTQNLFILSKTFALGIADGIRQITGIEIKIKWPNDIYAGDKKICGMLIENSIRNPNVNHTVLGIGLNVNQDFYPIEIPNAASLKILVGHELDLDECFCCLCNAIEKRYLQLKAGHFDQIHEDYVAALYRYGAFHRYENPSEQFRAKITAVGDDGKLFLKRENGLIEKYDFKEVKFII